MDLTVDASTAGEALDLAVSCLRSAIHAAGGSTHGWDTVDAGDMGSVAFVIADDEGGLNVRRITQLIDA